MTTAYDENNLASIGCGNNDACIAELATVQYSINASSLTYNQILLASGDCTLWVIINSSTVGLITNPGGGEFPFIRSSEGNYECSDGTEITDTLYTNVFPGLEDLSPFYCIDGNNCPLANTLFYSEGSSTFSTTSISSRNGMNVWVREVGITYPLCMIYYYIYILYIVSI